MEAEKNPFEAVQAMMLENLEKVEKVGGATQATLHQGFSGGLPHSGRVLSVPVQGRRR